MRPRRTETALARILVPLLAATLIGAAACGEEPAPEDTRRQIREPEDEAGSSVAPARYRSEVAFVSFEAGGPSVYLRLEQTARFERLERSYRAWTIEDGGPRVLLSVVDTLPVPRAGWRVLPAAGLRVVAGEDGRIRTLTLGDAAPALRLSVDSTLAEWSGATGQRERLAAGRAVRGGDTVPGIVLQRRQARPLEEAGRGGDAGFLLVAGAPDVGAAVLLSAGGESDTTAAVHGLYGGSVRSWSGARLERSGDGRPPAWEVRVGDGGFVLDLPAPVPDTTAGDAVPAAVEGTLRLEGGSRSVAGLIVVGG